MKMTSMPLLIYFPGDFKEMGLANILRGLGERVPTIMVDKSLKEYFKWGEIK